jgi:ABC-type bacteriocin/lantibiotic exporter with double-glycine peptidase domain
MPQIKIKQHDITDCGAACLASVAAHYQLQLPIARIRQYAGTDKKGTNLLGLREAAEKLGFEAKGVKGELKHLYKIPLPAIAHVVLKSGLHHYVVIYTLSKKGIVVMDPGTGQMETYTLEAFEAIWSGALLLLLPKDDFVPRNEKVSVYQRFWALLFPHKVVLLQCFIGAIAITLLGLAPAIYIQKLTDFALPTSNRPLVNLLGVIMVVVLLFQTILSVFKDVFILKVGQQIDAKLILGYYKHLLKLPQSFFDSMRVGEIISRVGDAVKIRAFINGVALNLLVDGLVIIFAFAFMFAYYWKLALVMLLVIPMSGLVYYLVNRFNKKTERRVMEQAAELESQLVESLNSIKTIKHFGLEGYANIKTETRFISLLKTGYRSALNSVFSGTSSTILAQLFTIVLLWVGSVFVMNQEITIGELLSFYAIIGYFTGPIGRMVSANVQIQNALIAADRLFEIMDLENEVEKQTSELTREQLGDIVFDNVYFRYGTRKEVFQGFSAVFPQSKITAIVGESGSGKSTLVGLIQKLYVIDKGSISIGGQNLDYISTESLKQCISVVPQHIDLFAGNVIDNIAVGEFVPDMDRMVSICKSIGILSFIEQLPNGFNTYLGEHGAALSGGEKQRIAIARALYQTP